jgi:biopolymer transport protein ExbB/TolQ
MALKKSQRSLKTWTKQKWRTRSGKPSVQGSKATGEKYLPEAKIKSMSKKEYDRLTRRKRADLKKGIQYSRAKKRGK